MYTVADEFDSCICIGQTRFFGDHQAHAHCLCLIFVFSTTIRLVAHYVFVGFVRFTKNVTDGGFDF